MELPDDVLRLIKEYSMPLTRPDWRYLRLMDDYIFHLDILDTFNRKDKCVINRFIAHRMMQCTKYIYDLDNYGNACIKIESS